ncbi:MULTISPECIES: BglG family transcription antiterminator [Bacillota]|uniref:Transcription antiterminator n=2 Tax=Amedibacillus TaxID=2749846 RepID=A0A7G9GJ44_9FIRM|nr:MULTISPECIES: transcription antiterminator [Bacillota]QNM10826.1 transcription antiterminator [[Eubacterium] hominis]MCH4285258.1 transcription antiterminator [Amedibacillus hominis]RGB58321.1 transcription antiterminator [Absiella sp. AM22-9]RGB63208.1 transcription antiterminator [Absiella sp. AM10-20]RGB65078.1 transcription antiterminator [Absiella sp. AM09-45]
MIYSPRLKKILEYCLEMDAYVSVDTLANICKTSTRTIFREIKDIDQDLKAYDLQLTKTKAGLCIEGKEENKAFLLKELKVQGIAYLDKTERRNMLIFELLHSEDLEKLIHYAGMFQVSEATISNDLDAIEPWLQTYDLSLLRKPGFGVQLIGKEENFRRAITSIVNQSIVQNEQLQRINFLDSSSLLHQIFIDTGSQSILKLLDQDILTRVLHVFETYQHELSLDRYASVGYIGLIIHLVIAIDRIQKHEAIEESNEVLSMVHMDPAFQQARKMAYYLEIEFDIDIPDVEIAFIALHIKGAKITRPEDKAHATTLKQQVYEMLKSFDEAKRVILLSDEEFMNGLLTHLEPTIIRLKNNLPIYNPLKETISTMYHDLYEQTKQACQYIEKCYDCKVSDDEIAFITMHVGASIERNQQKKLKKREVMCGVVCASGIGVSALLSARISKAIPEGIKLKTLSMEDITRHHYEDMELLISTFDLQLDDTEVLMVTPLLNDEDLHQLLMKLHPLWEKEGIKPLNKQSNLLYRIKEASHLAVDILEEFQTYTIDDTLKINDMIHFVSSHCRESESVYTALMKREQMGSVIMEDFHFILLHALVPDIKKPMMMCLYPKQHFQHYPNICFVQVMLMRKDASEIEQELCSYINRSIIEDDVFLTYMQKGNREDIVKHLQMIEEQYVKECIEE